MKNNILMRIIILAMVFFAFACTPKKEEIAIDKEKIKAEIQEIENQFALVYNIRNADSLTYYGEDAVSYFNDQKPIVGKAAIHEFINNELKELEPGVKISNQTLEIYVTSDGNVVAEIGAYKRVDSVGNVLQTGHFFSIFKKVDGKYVCVRDMANTSPIEDNK
jgi:ketosteroid isomerase-like protein